MESVTVSGTVFDSVSGESLPGVHVYALRDGGAVGTDTAADGSFRFDFFAGEWVLFSSVGYRGLGYVVDPSWLESIRVELVPGVGLDEAVIYPDPANVPPVAASGGGFGFLALLIAAGRAAHRYSFDV